MAESFKVQTKMEKNEISVDREKGVEKQIRWTISFKAHMLYSLKLVLQELYIYIICR